MNRRKLIIGAAAVGAMGGVSSCAKGTPYDASAAAELYPPIGQFVDLPGGRKVHYWESGRGQPLILIHGASGNLRDWTFAIAPELSREYRVIAFDRPGFGYTDRDPESGWDPAVQARTLRLAAQRLGVKWPIVAGHSLGGAVALAWGIQDPEETRGLIPISSVAMPYRGIVRVVRALGLDAWFVNMYTGYMRRTAADGGIDRFITRVFRPLEPPPGYLEYIGAPLALREATLQANAEDFRFLNPSLERMAKSYHKLKPPMEIIHGREDFISADHHAVPLSQSVPGARLTLLEGVGHMAHHANPDAIRDAARRLAA